MKKETTLKHFLYQFNYNQYETMYKLKMMVYYAFSKSKFYNKKFKGIIDIDKKINISELPFVTREELKSTLLGPEITPNYFEEEYGIFRTSSCGRNAFLYARPLKLNRFNRMAACFINAGKWKIGDPWIKLTALNCLETAQPLNTPLRCNIVNTQKDDLVIVIPPSENFIKESFRNIKRIYELIKNSKSRLIHANPAYLKLLLYAFRKKGLVLEGEYAINSTYELLLPSTERLIKKYLDCEIYDQYGCSEIGPVSFTCKYGNYHIFSNAVFVEVLPCSDLGRNDVGRIIVTDLENTVMPFVKYFTGDFSYITNRQECSCDFSTPLMGKIMGRENEIISFNGKVIFPLELDHIFCDLDNILMYQVIFENGQFIIKLVPEDNSRKIEMGEISKRFKKVFEDKECRLDTEIVEFILPNRRGKYSTIIVK